MFELIRFSRSIANRYLRIDGIELRINEAGKDHYIYNQSMVNTEDRKTAPTKVRDGYDCMSYAAM